MHQNDKEIKPSYHVDVCYNLHPVHNKLTLCVQWNIE